MQCLSWRPSYILACAKVLVASFVTFSLQGSCHFFKDDDGVIIPLILPIGPFVELEVHARWLQAPVFSDMGSWGRIRAVQIDRLSTGLQSCSERVCNVLEGICTFLSVSAHCTMMWIVRMMWQRVYVACNGSVCKRCNTLKIMSEMVHVDPNPEIIDSVRGFL